jgi:cell division protein FtsL
MSEQDRPEDETENTSQQGDPSTAPVEAVHSEADEDSADTETQVIKDASKPMTRFERVTIGLAIVGTLLAIGTAVIFHNQFKEMAGQTDLLNIAAKQARRDSASADAKTQQALDLARKQTDAAQKSVKAIQRQMRQDQRAWIIFNPSPPVVTDDGPFFQQFQVVNTGKTPAKIVRIDADIEVVNSGSSPRLKYKKPHPALVTGALYPNIPAVLTIDRRQINQTTGQEEPSFLKHKEWLSLQDGDSYTATYLLVTYRDAFKVKHWQKLCTWKVHAVVKPDFQGGGGFVAERYFNAAKCAAYNDTDNN